MQKDLGIPRPLSESVNRDMHKGVGRELKHETRIDMIDAT